MQPRRAYLTADEIVSRSNPVMEEMQRMEKLERSDSIHFLLGILGAAFVVCTVLSIFFLF